MGFLERAIRNGISKGVGDAIGKAVQKVIEPTATEIANKAAESFDQATNHNTERSERPSAFGGFESALSNLQRSAENYATQAAKNMKICPSCNKPNTAENTFCQDCGARLPETTIAQGAVCTECGKQNTVGTKFCSGCGAKLPAAIQEEQAEKSRGDEVMVKWDEILSVYPKWNCGGVPVDIEIIETDIYSFTVDFKGDSISASRGVEQYRQYAMQNGFRMAGEYPNKENLYCKINGVCYHIDTEHCFDGDSDCPVIYFDIREPSGGYDYVKPEPKQKTSLFDLFK